MGKVVAVYSMKGGVGKTSLAVNLAERAVAAGRRALLWDVDAQGAASFVLGAESGKAARKIFSKDVEAADLIQPTGVDGLDLIAADLSLRHLEAALDADSPKRLRKLLADLVPDYDVVVLDCPPGLGAMSEQIFRAADLIVVPVVPAPLALRTLEQVREALAQQRGKKAPALLPVFSMVDRRKALHRAALEENADWPAIPHASVVEQMGLKQAPLADFAPRSPAAGAVQAVWDKVWGLLG